MISTTLRVVFMGILASLFGSASANEPLSGHVVKEDNFVDITLPVASQQFNSDGSISLTARGKINGEVLGFSLELAPDWKISDIKDVPIKFFNGSGKIITTGAESDLFLKLLIKEYGLASPKPNMASSIAIAMVSFGQDPRELKSKPAQIKIFFESDDEDAYAEAFINIDLQKMQIEFRDKDPEYHQGILTSLSSGT